MNVSTIKRQSRILVAVTVAATVLILMLVTFSGLPVAEARGPASEVTGDLHVLQSSSVFSIYLPILFKANTTFFDDFSSTSSGWPHKKTYENCYMEYRDGRYYIKVSKYAQRCIIPNFNIPVLINGTFSVKVRRTSDKDRELFYGLIFGAGEVAAGSKADRWALEVFPNNEENECDSKKPLFWLVALEDGEPKYFKTKCSDEIDKDKNDWNELKVVRNGQNIKIYINGDLEANYTDAKYLLNEGHTLLEVISASDETITVEFDDLRITPDIN